MTMPVSGSGAGLRRGDFGAFRSIQTRWMDNDAYGHVNNAIYYSWFDTAVNALLIDWGLLDVESGAVIGLVVETGCRYHRSVRFPEIVEAGVRVARLGGSSVRWEVGLFTAGHEGPAAEGFFVHVHVDRASRRPVPLPAAWRSRLATLDMGSMPL
ncbi:acyl-CoA thioesterase [Polymorphobacter multimanifer]|uniref:Acyl-CoA thioester hydrolase n=1 Tax=Polymorphobacter multimanifer TaxID=1070431 RepID=A0A841L4M8_9SPHN|nr:thioesterase family protein [Polymorphobacter multimanifer]MBB6227584.1 acyl-CoA thioester hydrolase [Polymorphobacter multimanifer]